MGGFVWFWDKLRDGISWDSLGKWSRNAGFHGFSWILYVYQYLSLSSILSCRIFFSASACCIGEASHQLAGRSKTFGNLRSRLPISEKLSFSFVSTSCWIDESPHLLFLFWNWNLMPWFSVGIWSGHVIDGNFDFGSDFPSFGLCKDTLMVTTLWKRHILCVWYKLEKPRWSTDRIQYAKCKPTILFCRESLIGHVDRILYSEIYYNA